MTDLSKVDAANAALQNQATMAKTTKAFAQATTDALHDFDRRLVAVEQPVPVPPPVGLALPKAGISTGYQSMFSLGVAKRDLMLDRCKEAHAKIVRYDVTSSSMYDGAAAPAHAAIKARGMESLMILHGTSKTPFPASTADALARYVGSRTDCRVFEFCNEPDLNGWTPEQYADASWGFCNALRQIRPDATLILGANWKFHDVGADIWVQRVLARWGNNKPSFDCWSFHLYDDDTWANDQNIWRQAFGPLTAPRVPARKQFDNAGLSHIKIVSTENGGPRPKYSEAQQSALIKKDFAAVADGRLAMQLVFTMMPDPAALGYEVCDANGNRLAPFFTYQSLASGL